MGGLNSGDLIRGWIFSYIWTWPGSFGKNVMTNLVGTKPYSDQLSVWGHFTASTNQIRTSLLKQTSWHLLSVTGAFTSNHVHTLSDPQQEVHYREYDR